MVELTVIGSAQSDRTVLIAAPGPHGLCTQLWRRTSPLELAASHVRLHWWSGQDYHVNVVIPPPTLSLMREVRVESRKWPDDQHWEFDAVRLGADAFGVWLGIAGGTPMSRPGATLVAAADHVTLAPYDDWYLATFYGGDPQRPFDVYVDIATPAVWHDETRVCAVDLDLDVIRGTTGRVWVDDEDEFAEHRVSLGYPADVVAEATASCDRVAAAVRDGLPPFDPVTSQDWLARFRRGAT